MPLHLEKTVAGISSSNCLQPSLSEKGEFRKQIPLEGKWCQLLSAQRECIWPQHVWRKYKKCRIPYYKWESQEYRGEGCREVGGHAVVHHNFVQPSTQEKSTIAEH